MLKEWRTAGLNDRSYIEIEVNVSGFDTDHLSGTLHQCGCLGVLESDDEHWVVYLPGDWDADALRGLGETLNRLNSAFQLRDIQIKRLPFQDWNKEWRQFFKPFKLLDDVWIRPPWESLPPQAGGVEIIIEPQMAFGTGHHETTQLMMGSIREYGVRGKSVLDLGSGSGILGMFAMLEGASSAIGIDIDPDATANALHNLELNRLEGATFKTGTFEDIAGQTFDLILANINLNVLLDLPLHLYQGLNVGGAVILSGILKGDVSRLSYLYKQSGLVLGGQFNMGEWVALIWEKRG